MEQRERLKNNLDTIMCKPTELSSRPASAGGVTARQIFFAATSFILGAWAFIKVNSISGPAFEPIIAACTNPEFTSPAEFAAKTGYHIYEPKVGLVAFNMLVCLITQFLLELRETPPAGLLVWGGVIVVSLPLAISNTVAAGRKGVKGPVRYPTIIGLLSQLLGISVIYPMIWVPSYIFSGSKLGAPVTNKRIIYATCATMPGVILTYLVFTANTDGSVWTYAAGILGGPGLVLCGLIMYTDNSESMAATNENISKCSNAIQSAYSIVGAVSFAFWICLVAVAYGAYGFEHDKLWNDIWVEAGPSVAFMTIDTGVLFLGALLFIGYENGLEALKALLVTPFVGPGASCCMALKELESAATSKLLNGDNKKEV